MSVLEIFKQASWLRKLNNRDEAAFVECYDFYAPKLYRHAFYRLGSKELAEDVVSEVFIKTWEFLTDPNKKISNLKAFLYRVANNLIIDYYRGQERQSILIDEVLAAQLGDMGRAKEKMINKLEFEAVLKSLEKLNSETRKILIWRYIDQLDIREISEITGKKANAIYVAIHRGLKEIKKIINEPL